MKQGEMQGGVTPPYALLSFFADLPIDPMILPEIVDAIAFGVGEYYPSIIFPFWGK